ncbi:MAG: LLM class flavin-dependent oxidoreductase [Candidatus Odinarchaeota archaeon]
MKLSFGIQLEPQFGYMKKDVDKLAEKASRYKFDTIWVSDHMFLDEKAVDKSAFDSWTLMTYLVTKFKLRVGSLVLCNSYRHPSILAKMVSTLDHLSGGRIEFGYGAGWKEMEYKAYGIEFPPVKTRLEQLEEGLQVIKKLWSEEKASFSGKHYTLDEAICYPKPLQKPHPRIVIGSMTGGKKMLQIAAKHGDMINLAWSFTPERCKEIFQQLDSYTSEASRNKLLRSVGFWVRLYASEEEKQAKMKEGAQQRNFSIEEYTKRLEGALVGTKEEITEKLAKYIKLGVTHFVFMFPAKEEPTYLRIFNDEIFPSVI